MVGCITTVHTQNTLPCREMWWQRWSGRGSPSSLAICSASCDTPLPWTTSPNSLPGLPCSLGNLLYLHARHTPHQPPSACRVKEVTQNPYWRLWCQCTYWQGWGPGSTPGPPSGCWSPARSGGWICRCTCGMHRNFPLLLLPFAVCGSQSHWLSWDSCWGHCLSFDFRSWYVMVRSGGGGGSEDGCGKHKGKSCNKSHVESREVWRSKGEWCCYLLNNSHNSCCPHIVRMKYSPKGPLNFQWHQ